MSHWEDDRSLICVLLEAYVKAQVKIESSEHYHTTYMVPKKPACIIKVSSQKKGGRIKP